MHENRETSLPTARASGSPAGEGESRTSGMHSSEESDVWPPDRDIVVAQLSTAFELNDRYRQRPIPVSKLSY
jgi:hypothetical protein